MSPSNSMLRLRTWTVLASVVMTCALASAVMAKTPIPVSPGAQRPGSVSEARCPTFSWSGVPEAGGYEIAVFRVAEENDAEPVLLTRVSVPNDSRSFTLPAGECLERGERYAWSVAATGHDGTPVWAEPFLFEVEAAPSVEELEQTMATIRRHLEKGQEGQVAALDRPLQLEAPRGKGVAGAGLVRDPPRETGATGDERAARAKAPRSVGSLRDVATADGADSGNTLRTASATTATDPSDASLAVSGHLRLGAASAIVKDDDLWLWDDLSQNTGLGRHALSNVGEGGRKNTGVGWDALRNTTGGDELLDGSFNTGLGYAALRANTIGFDNTAVGFGALLLNQTGSDNTAVGTYALRSNTSVFNTAVGSEALSSNTSGRDNTAVGYGALSANTSGSYNTATGMRALASNTAGSSNTATATARSRATLPGPPTPRWVSGRFATTPLATNNVAAGRWSLGSNTVGFQNLAMGHSALFTNIAGARNVAIGDGALPNSNSNANTAVGYGALANTTTGVANTAIGYAAGAYNQTGTQNIFIRSFGNPANPAESNTIHIGLPGTQAGPSSPASLVPWSRRSAPQRNTCS